MTNQVLRATTALAIVLGVLAAIHGQNFGTTHGAPDPAARIAWALIPMALLALCLFVVAKSRVDLLLLLTVSAVVALTSDYSQHDELGLVFIFMPLMQLLLVGFVLGVILMRRASHPWIQ